MILIFFIILIVANFYKKRNRFLFVQTFAKSGTHRLKCRNPLPCNVFREK